MPEITEEQRKAFEEKLKKMSPEELREFQKQQCIFCQIIAGKVPSKKVFEDEKSIAILDINPAAKGHLLILPKEHYAIMPQMPEKELSHLFLVSKALSQLLLKTLKVGGTNLFIANGVAAGQKAQHFMIHLIPRKEGDKILEIEEKLLDAELRKKVKLVVEKRLNDLLGIKKEVVDVPAKGEKTGSQKKLVPEDVPEKADEEEKEPETAAEKGKSGEEAEESVSEPSPEEEPAEEQDQKPAKGSLKKKPVPGKKSVHNTKKAAGSEGRESPNQDSEDSAEEGSAEEAKEEKKDSDDSVDLDDIVKLFR